MDGLTAAQAAIRESLVFGGGSPVDFDLTVLFMIGLFLTMMVVLNRVLFQPYLRTRDTRYERIQGAKKEAQLTQDRAEQTFSDYETQIGSAYTAGKTERAKFIAEGKAESRGIVDGARGDIEQILEASRSELRAQVETARAAMQSQAADLSKLIVDKVLAG